MTNRVYVDDIEADDGIVGIKKWEEKNQKRNFFPTTKKWDWNLGFLCDEIKECCCSCGFVILFVFSYYASCLHEIFCLVQKMIRSIQIN